LKYLTSRQVIVVAVAISGCATYDGHHLKRPCFNVVEAQNLKRIAALCIWGGEGDRDCMWSTSFADPRRIAVKLSPKNSGLEKQ
jgi:hypothetical protein